jgi:hypothetical protein
MNTEATADLEALDYWGVGHVDQSIRIAPFPCGRYVCPNHDDDETELESTGEAPAGVTAAR